MLKYSWLEKIFRAINKPLVQRFLRSEFIVYFITYKARVYRNFYCKKDADFCTWMYNSHYTKWWR